MILVTSYRQDPDTDEITTTNGTDVLIAANGTEVVGTYFESSDLFRANGDPVALLYVIHHSTADGRLLLRRDHYAAEVAATITPRTRVGSWA